MPGSPQHEDHRRKASGCITQCCQDASIAYGQRNLNSSSLVASLLPWQNPSVMPNHRHPQCPVPQPSMVFLSHHQIQVPNSRLQCMTIPLLVHPLPAHTAGRTSPLQVHTLRLIPFFVIIIISVVTSPDQAKTILQSEGGEGADLKHQSKTKTLVSDQSTNQRPEAPSMTKAQSKTRSTRQTQITEQSRIIRRKHAARRTPTQAAPPHQRPTKYNNANFSPIICLAAALNRRRRH